VRCRSNMRTLLVLILCGCQPVVRTDSLRAGGDVTSVRVDVEAGSVRVEGADIVDIEVSRTTSGPAGSVVVANSVRDGVLVLEGGCRALAPCTVDFVVRVPRGLPVDVRTGAGRVDLADVGPTLVDIGTGDLAARGAVPSLHARVGWGDCDVRLDALPDDLALDLAGGDARVVVPDGTYTLDLAAFNGTDVAGLDDGPGPRLHVRTQSGQVVVRGVGATQAARL
jgi:hypothetical protein